jgi:16S rRNA G1207 methylase RsmC
MRRVIHHNRSMSDTVDRWVIGDPATLREGDAFLALDLAGHRRALASGVRSVPFHMLLPVGGGTGPAPEVLVEPPTWRGYAFVEVLEWLVTSRLAVPSVSRVEWVAGVKSGATGVRRILAARGWDVAMTKERGRVHFVGTPPSPGAMPSLETFEAEFNRRRLEFASGWGSFSREHVDEGTSLLYEVVAGFGPVPLVVDIGTGYGVLAVALVAGRHAQAAVGTEIDSVSLHLAQRNAECAGVALEAAFDDDPRRQPSSELTVCNVPTHADRANAKLLTDGLAARAAMGDVLIVVHASLEQRYRQALATQRTRVRVAKRSSHAVLHLDRR